ncbi:prepilin-type N-terminal cleavage/methylation domain-containing protein [Thioalkalivibrio sp. ALE19]|uniref:prepilin-type N-terminal cleavage/methylation domain-containing protein n=1 Tax=Thioalkalivibrio sp. ALE19 TaxID=1266909 RepID=UPI0003F6BCAF|nr:prepilin-type N-terminal cleavage/methylation domain-containing protein [Thioalkalivibrio sp. ALE19]
MIDRPGTGARAAGHRVRGLTLIELVVALVIIAVAMAGLAGTFALLTGVAGTEDAEQYAREARGCGEALLAVHGASALDFGDSCNGNGDNPEDWAEEDSAGGDVLAGACRDDVDLEVSCRIIPAADAPEDNPLNQVELRRVGGGMPVLYLQFPREDDG